MHLKRDNSTIECSYRRRGYLSEMGECVTQVREITEIVA
uniref:Uncharacterized protein n=1 Tax=Pseudomonas syringae TaxID=317 RepID=A9QS54_PSESX|nr:hypothetical protein [Pseudomonas syringae]